MRIISGEHKGRKIRAPKNLPVRPTTDFAKEALFNILNNRIYFDEVSVLDLFSGTGGISYEFASRGTENITSVDSNFQCVKFIEETSKALNLNLNVVKADAYKFLGNQTSKYDIIFADPPYSNSDEEFKRIVELVFQNNLLAKEGMLILEHSKKMDLSAVQNYSYSKSYGNSVFSFYSFQDDEEE